MGEIETIMTIETIATIKATKKSTQHKKRN